MSPGAWVVLHPRAQKKQRCRRCIWGQRGTKQPLLRPQETRGKKAKLGGGG